MNCILFNHSPLPTITWSFRSEVLNPAVNSDIMYGQFNDGKENRRKLIIKNLTADNEGTYGCTATQPIPGLDNTQKVTTHLSLNVTGETDCRYKFHIRRFQ